MGARVSTSASWSLCARTGTPTTRPPTMPCSSLDWIRFVVSSNNLLGTLMPGIREYVGDNAGTHVVHTGGARASSLQLPVQNR